MYCVRLPSRIASRTCILVGVCVLLAGASLWAVGSCFGEACGRWLCAGSDVGHSIQSTQHHRKTQIYQHTVGAVARVVLGAGAVAGK